MLRGRRIPAAREPLTSDDLITRPWFRYLEELLNGGMGSFFDTTIQTAAADTATAISFDTTTFSRYISLDSPRIYVSAAGLYDIQFSVQFTNDQASEDNVVVWIKVNGTNVADTSSWVTVPKKHGSLDGSALMALNLYYEFAAGDYFEMYWLTEEGEAKISPIAATATYPRSPSVILTVNQLI